MSLTRSITRALTQPLTSALTDPGKAIVASGPTDVEVVA